MIFVELPCWLAWGNLFVELPCWLAWSNLFVKLGIIPVSVFSTRLCMRNFLNYSLFHCWQQSFAFFFRFQLLCLCLQLDSHHQRSYGQLWEMRPFGFRDCLFSTKRFLLHTNRLHTSQSQGKGARLLFASMFYLVQHQLELKNWKLSCSSLNALRASYIHVCSLAFACYL